jgi:hypothetical protein
MQLLRCRTKRHRDVKRRRTRRSLDRIGFSFTSNEEAEEEEGEDRFALGEERSDRYKQRLANRSVWFCLVVGGFFFSWTS